MEERNFDVVVAGSGSAGLTAAVTAAHHGLKVVLLEKSARFGGTSAWSGGGCWVPDNPLLKQIGLDDSRGAAEGYVKAVVGSYLREDLFATFLDRSLEMLDFLLTKTEVEFLARKPAPDYHMDVPGALVGGRSLASPVYDARRLGHNLPRLELPLNSFNAPGGMMMSPLDFMHAMEMFKSWPSVAHIAKISARYAWDLVRYGRGTRVTMGNALMARLLRSAMDAGVTLWAETPVRRLIHDGIRVTGAVACRYDQEVVINAKHGVVLATGGFAANPELRARYYPQPALHRSMVKSTNTGDGLAIAQEVGAVIETNNAHAGSWCMVSTIEHPGAPPQHCMHFFMDLPKPGCIVVDKRGKRFGNEAGLLMGTAMQTAGAIPAWIICDRPFIKKYGLGLIFPYGLNLALRRRQGYVIEAQTLRALAGNIGVDPDGLEATISRTNSFADTGVDPDFKRGGSALDRSIGDSSHVPNPCLGQISTPPFYAVRLLPGDAGSVTGLDMNSLWAGQGIANGMNHAHNMTFGYIAGRHLGSVDEVPNPRAD